MAPFRIVLAHSEGADVWYVHNLMCRASTLKLKSFEALKARLGQAIADLLNSQLRIDGREAVYRANLPLEVIQHSGDDRLLA